MILFLSGTSENVQAVLSAKALPHLIKGTSPIEFNSGGRYVTTDDLFVQVYATMILV